MRIACGVVCLTVATMCAVAHAADAPSTSAPQTNPTPNLSAPATTTSATATSKGASPAAPAPNAPTASAPPAAANGKPPTAKSNDVPNAIDAMVPSTPDGATPTPAVVAPNEDMGNRMTHAILLLKSHEYADAESQLQVIVTDLEHQTSRYDPSLVTPYTLLGDALNGEGKYKEALRAYEQAQHIARVTEGLHTPTQVDLIYREAATLEAEGQVDKANDRMEYAYDTLTRAYGPFSPSILPGLYKLAAWYEHSSNIFAARGLYERAVQIVARTSSELDPAMVPALRGLAATYRDERFPPNEPYDPRQAQNQALLGSSAMPSVGEPPGIVVNRFGPGEAALIQVVKITQANPDAKPMDLVIAELDLGDWYLLFDKANRATPVYVHARQLMRTKAELSDEQIEAYFKPTVLYRPIPDGPPAPPPALRTNPTEGHVEVSFTVNDDGGIGDLKTVSSEPDGMMDIKVRRGMRAARYRPRFAGDIPIAAANQVYRHTFVYYPQNQTPEAKAGQKSDGTKAAPEAPDDAPATPNSAG